jgi:predicted DNA binding CopG/RHH family protein
MQQPGLAQSSPPSSSGFAGLLAALALPRRDEQDQQSALDRDELGDDVVTLSYERALRAHARYKPANPDEPKFALRAEGQRAPAREQRSSPQLSTDESAGPRATDRDLRRASVTIRVSEAELEQLRQRAGEAGLTISAYLRSCTIEAEALRAQVKQALAELRTQRNNRMREPANEEPVQRKHLGWIARFTGRRHSEARST